MSEQPPLGYVQVGRATPFGPAGDMWVSPVLIAQVGIQEVLRMVREIYSAAYRHSALQRSA